MFLEKELAELKLGKKAYPRELELARSEIARKLSEQTGKNIQVRIFADLIDIKDETWRSAIEGYLSWNKLALIVEPAYVKQAMEVYETLDEKRFFRVSLVDTEKLMQEEWRITVMRSRRKWRQKSRMCGHLWISCLEM